MLELVGDDEGSDHEDEGEQRGVGLRRDHILHRLPVGVGGVEHAAVDDDAAHTALEELFISRLRHAASGLLVDFLY